MFVKIAAERLVKKFANKIHWVAVLVVDCLEKRMFLRENVLAFGWMSMEREVREAGLMTGNWVP